MIEILAEAIAKHATELAQKEWARQMRPVLVDLLLKADLIEVPLDRPKVVELAPLGTIKSKSTLRFDDHEVSIEAFIEAIHQRFLAARTKELGAKLSERIATDAERIATDAGRKMIDEQKADEQKAGAL
jgi:hypothetical protein